MVSMPTATSGNSSSQEYQQTLLDGNFTSPSPLANDAPASPPLTLPSAAHSTLLQAADTLAQTAAQFPYTNMFESNDSTMDSFNPAALNNGVDDDGRWDAFSLGQPRGDLDIDFDAYLRYADLDLDNTMS